MCYLKMNTLECSIKTIVLSSFLRHKLTFVNWKSLNGSLADSADPDEMQK